jgi:hypothetical protein
MLVSGLIIFTISVDPLQSYLNYYNVKPIMHVHHYKSQSDLDSTQQVNLHDFDYL